MLDGSLVSQHCNTPPRIFSGRYNSGHCWSSRVTARHENSPSDALQFRRRLSNQTDKSSGSRCPDHVPKIRTGACDKTATVSTKAELFVEWQVTRFESFNVAGDTFDIGASQHRTDECCGYRLSFLARLNSKHQKIPVWPLTQPFMNPHKVCAQPYTTPQRCGCQFERQLCERGLKPATRCLR